MKLQTIKQLGLLLVISLLFSRCSNEVDAIGTWKEIPIIYGLIDQTNTEPSYIRVERAYLPPDTSAREIAQRPDSIYFGADEIEVRLYINNTLREVLERVDLDTLGIEKEEGIFAESPNIAYRFTEGVSLGERTYRLEVENLKTGKIYSATEQGMVLGNPSTIGYSNFGIIRPSTSQSVRWSNADYEPLEITFDWTQPEYAAIYDLTVRLNYYEFQIDANGNRIDSTQVLKELDWRPAVNIFAKASVSQTFNGELYYDFMLNSLSDVSGTNTRRCLVDVDVIVDAASESLANYIEVSSANTGLIGGLFPLEPYTNFEDGYGFFAFKARITKRLQRIDSDFVAYLNEIERMQRLGFVDYKCFR